MNRETNGLLVVAMSLVAIGVIMVYSASAVNAFHSSLTGLDYLGRQLIYAAIGLTVMFSLARVDYHHLRKPSVYRPIVLGALFLLIAVLLFGEERGGARRWLTLWFFSFQPSEVAKFALIVILAVKLTENRDEVGHFFRGFLPPVAITIVFAALIFFQRDLGTPVVICAISGIMIFLAGTRWSFVVVSTAPMVAAVIGLIVTSPYRWDRFVSFFNPWDYRDDEGYQLIQSMSAFAYGSIFGRGPGASEQKLFYLPEAHTDFIFAIWGEEMGLVGSLFMAGLFIAMLVLSFRIAMCAPDTFGALLAVGIGSLITVQAAFNMAVTVGLLPTKGLPLPFVSAGGTALIVNLALVGVLLSVGLRATDEDKLRPI